MRDKPTERAMSVPSPESEPARSLMSYSVVGGEG
jgi:hypothetical protein